MKESVFAPLGMTDTRFVPDASLRARAAPTERRGNAWLTGYVHDPRAARLHGVAGHAGLFSTVDDLSRFAAVLLRQGQAGSPAPWPPASVLEMLRPQGAPSHPRTLGWDVVPSFDPTTSTTRDTFGHGGFTGPQMWIDPHHDLFAILLSSRLHPDGRGDAHRLWKNVRSILLDAVPRIAPAPAANPPVRVGIDVLRRDGFAALRGARVVLVTHAAAVAADGTRTLDILHASPTVTVTAVWTPEHGLDARANGGVPDGRDEGTGLPVFSLYGPRRVPGPAQLAGADTIVVDLQDAGARFYTYLATLRSVLEAARRLHRRVVVLDRPNPGGGTGVEGPLPDPSADSFLHPHPVPVRHGLTLGELALLIDRDRGLGVRPHVVPMEGWRRSMRSADTGLAWRSPSPNLRSPDAALLYPGVALLEMTNVSVGRGTDTPFELVGAPWIDDRLAARMSASALPGVAFAPAAFSPVSGPYAGLRCRGVRLRVTDPAHVRPVRLGLALAVAIRALYGSRWNDQGMATLLANHAVLTGIRRGEDVERLEARTKADVDAFVARRASVLLYR